MREKYKSYADEERLIIDSATQKLQSCEEKNKILKGFLLRIRATAFCRFFIVRWKCFKKLHPKIAKLIAQFASFLLFSCSVTVWQYLVMLFLP